MVPRNDSHWHPHSLARLGRRPRWPPTLSLSTRSFSSSSSPRAARISSCSRRFSCAQRTELPRAEWGHCLPFHPPSSARPAGAPEAPGLWVGKRTSGPGRGGGCGGADSAAVGAGAGGGGACRAPDAAEEWPSVNGVWEAEQDGGDLESGSGGETDL